MICCLVDPDVAQVSCCLSGRRRIGHFSSVSAVSRHCEVSFRQDDAFSSSTVMDGVDVSYLPCPGFSLHTVCSTFNFVFSCISFFVIDIKYVNIKYVYWFVVCLICGLNSKQRTVWRPNVRSRYICVLYLYICLNLKRVYI